MNNEININDLNEKYTKLNEKYIELEKRLKYVEKYYFNCKDTTNVILNSNTKLMPQSYFEKK